MWSRDNKIWTHYGNGILAVDCDSASFLKSYMRYMLINRPYLNVTEVIDLQRYKVYSKRRHVARAVNDRLNIPFIFLTFSN